MKAREKLSLFSPFPRRVMQAAPEYVAHIKGFSAKFVANCEDSYILRGVVCAHHQTMTKLRINEVLRPSLLATLAAVALGGRWSDDGFRAELSGHAATARTGAADGSQAGIPVSELAPNAPDEYTVKPRRHALGYLAPVPAQPVALARALGHEHQARSRTRTASIQGQVLYLDKTGGRARLSTRPARGGAPDGTIKLSPRTRYESLSGMALPTLNPSLIEPFLSEPIVVDEGHPARPRPASSAGNDSRVLLARGDRAYARGEVNSPAGRDRRPDQDLPHLPQRHAAEGPRTGEILGYEAQYLGKAPAPARRIDRPAQMIEGKQWPQRGAGDHRHRRRTRGNARRRPPAARAGAASC